MMRRASRVIEVETRIVRKAFADAQWNPRVRWKEKTAVIVLLRTDDGFAGVGEAYCDGGSTASVASIIRQDLAPIVSARPLFDLGAIVSTMRETLVVSAKGGAAWAAISALDIALWDLLGRALGVPLCTLLGAERRGVFAYASGGLYGQSKSLDDLAREMRSYVDLGFRGVKLKVGGASVAEDLRRVAAVRDAIGPDVRLMVDALYALSVPDAVRMGKGLERFDVHFLEAPIAPEDMDGLARVAAASPVPVAGNEFAYGLDGFRRLVGAVTFVHLDAILCGGISEARRIAALAAAHHRLCSFHSASTVVCFAANLHAAASVPNVDSIEFHMLHRLLFDQIPKDRFRLVDGCVQVPDLPGIGVETDAFADWGEVLR